MEVIEEGALDCGNTSARTNLVLGLVSVVATIHPARRFEGRARPLCIASSTMQSNIEARR